MSSQFRYSLAAGFCFGLTLAAPAAAQLSAAGSLLLQQGVDGIRDLREANDRFGGIAADDPLVDPRLGKVLAWGDFNGDGFDDLAIAVPYEDVGAFTDEGIVQVVYGGPAGLTPAGDQRFTRSSIPGAGGVEQRQRMGLALARGDFDGDAFDDLAIGIPFDDANDVIFAGSMLVLHGSPSGLLTTGAQLWNQSTPGVQGGSGGGDRFGMALAAGDFDGDGRSDLAIGIPGERIEDEFGAGAVTVLFGGLAGLTASDDLLFDRSAFGLQPEALQNFGDALTAGDFDGDGQDDLVVGAPGVQVETFEEAGEIYTLLGQSDRELAPAGVIQRSDVRCGVGPFFDEIGAGDRFGSTLAAGDFNGDGRSDLAIGIPGATVEGPAGDPRAEAGQVDVLYSVVVQGDCWNQAVPETGPTEPLGDESFGAALAAGDVTGDGVDDLVIGVPGETLGIGGLHVLHGAAEGLAPAPEPFWIQGSLGVPDDFELGDAFGSAVALGDANGDGFADLAVGVPGEEIDNSEPNHGAIHLLYSGDRIFADGFESGSLGAWSSAAQ